MSTKEPFIINRIKSVGYAFNGLLVLVKTESSIKIQIVIALLVTAAGFYFDISITAWLAQTIMMGLVISIEGINTALEYMADFIHPEQHQKIGLIKDIAAGAVLIASFFAAIIAVIIYEPYLL